MNILLLFSQRSPLEAYLSLVNPVPAAERISKAAWKALTTMAPT